MKPVPVALIALTLPATASAQNTYRYSFGQGLVAPRDVAVYRECIPGPEWVFVADPGAGALFRYPGDGSSNPAPDASAPALADLGPFGVAVDDSIASPRRGQVYTTTHDTAGTFGLVWIYKDVSLVDSWSTVDDGPTCAMITWLEGSTEFALRRPEGIAVDLQGNLYVADPTADRVLRVDAAKLVHQGEVCIQVEADLVLDTGWNQPTDVSVDQAGRMHVTHPCGCVPVFHPDGTLVGLGAIAAGTSSGIDAKDDHLDTRVTRSSTVSGWRWDVLNETRAFFEEFGSFVDPRGMEFQKYARLQLDGRTRCEDRLFIADAGAQAIVVWGEDFLSTPLPANAVAFWRLDDPVDPELLDSVGSNDMLLAGSVLPVPIDGRVRSGLAFDAGLGEGTVADDPSLDFGAGDFSVEGWIRAEAEAGTRTVFDKRDGVNGYHAFLYNGYFGFQLMSGSSFENGFSTSDANYVAGGPWHHFAVTVARQLSGQERLRIFVDGVETFVDTTPLLGSLDNAAALRVGRHMSGTNGITGVLDELTFYRRALSASEIAKIVAAGCAGKHAGLSIVDVYCTAETFATGCIPTIDAEGEPSSSGASEFTVRVADACPGTFGFLVAGTSGAAWIPFQGGVLCVQPPLTRTPPTVAVGSGPCGGRLDFDFGTQVLQGLPAGSEVWTQCWMRDPAAGGGPPMLREVPFVLSDALHITVLP